MLIFFSLKTENMKFQLLLLVLSFFVSDKISVDNDKKRDFTNIYHYGNNISVRNFDGTLSTVYINFNSATLFNPDGTQSTIDSGKNSSRLITSDGNVATVVHSGYSSTVRRANGTQFLISHRNSTSSCSTEDGKHTIMHNFGFVEEICNKNMVDVLVHANWLIQLEVAQAAEETSEVETGN